MDAEKRFRLLEYISAARSDHQCSGLSALFSPDEKVIDAYRAMFADEPHFCPVLVGPSAVPIILTVEEAIRRPTLATLSAIVHARSEHGPAIIETVVESWRHLEAPGWHADARILWSCIPEEVMEKLSEEIREQRTIDWNADDDDEEPSEWEKGTGLYQRAQRVGRAEGRAEGLLAGLRRSLELALGSRGLIPSHSQRAVMNACSSIETLERWLVRVTTATSVAELLEA